jgi:ubiquinone/menaquinone biosynthesis C-methylase UbiE
MREYDKSIEYWNKEYGKCKLEDLTGEMLEVEPMFDTCLEIFSKKCRRVLDFGCGTGDIIFQCEEYGNLEYGLGIDRSEEGIDFSIKMAHLNHCRQIDFVIGDITCMSQMEDGSFDGIIISNVLDTVPKETADIVFQELTRLLKAGGLMLVKLNPDYTNEQLNGYGFQCLRDNLYMMDDVLCLRKLDTREWKKYFEKYFDIIRYLEFPYPWQPGMNRLFLLKKR